MTALSATYRTILSTVCAHTCTCMHMCLQCHYSGAVHLICVFVLRPFISLGLASHPPRSSHLCLLVLGLQVPVPNQHWGLRPELVSLHLWVLCLLHALSSMLLGFCLILVFKLHPSYLLWYTHTPVKHGSQKTAVRGEGSTLEAPCFSSQSLTHQAIAPPACCFSGVGCSLSSQVSFILVNV